MPESHSHGPDGTPNYPDAAQTQAGAGDIGGTTATTQWQSAE